MKLTHLALTLTIAMLMSAKAFAGDVGKLYFFTDPGDRSNYILTATLFTNEAVAGPSGSVSATCPSNAKMIHFDPGVSGDFRIKANGSGTPTGGTVSDGTGWRNNVAEYLPINDRVSGTTINSWAVYSSTPSNTVPYTCHAVAK